MKERFRSPTVPREVIRLTYHTQLDLYLTECACGELGLVLLLGRRGTGKSESVKQALAAPTMAEPAGSMFVAVGRPVAGHTPERAGPGVLRR